MRPYVAITLKTVNGGKMNKTRHESKRIACATKRLPKKYNRNETVPYCLRKMWMSGTCLSATKLWCSARRHSAGRVD